MQPDDFRRAEGQLCGPHRGTSPKGHAPVSFQSGEPLADWLDESPTALPGLPWLAILAVAAAGATLIALAVIQWLPRFISWVAG